MTLLASETVYLNCNTAAVADMFCQCRCHREKHTLPFFRYLCLCRRRLQRHQPYFPDKNCRRFQLCRKRSRIFRHTQILAAFVFSYYSSMIDKPKISPFRVKYQPRSALWVMFGLFCSSASRRLCAEYLGFCPVHNQGNNWGPRRSLMIDRTGCLARLFVNIARNVVTFSGD